jgi:cyclopropane-fatty-acyl-phospholipid synthase
MALLDRILNGRIHHGRLTIIREGSVPQSYGDGAQGWPQATLRVHSPSAERRILMNPRLGMAETYMDGSVSVDNDDIMSFIELVRRNAPWEKGGEIGDPGLLKLWLKRLSKPLQQLNSLTRSKNNVAHHYDLSNDFYRLWLDDDMQYSCAYWADGVATLEAAQTAKKAHIAAKLMLEPGQRVLDIGCGWGGMALYLNRVADVEVLGITLSEEQLKLARKRAEAAGVANKVRFELMDYRALAEKAPGYFDRIVSVGMFEHVGIPQFDTFFRAAANLMTDEGVLLLHTIGRMGQPGATDAFTRKYIFPGGYIPAISETIEASEKVKLIATDIESLRLHYALTLRKWYQRVEANKEAIIAMMDVRFYRMWTFYLAGAVAAFESGGMCNHQYQFVRNRRALPMTRDYMAKAEKAYLAKG